MKCTRRLLMALLLLALLGNLGLAEEYENQTCDRKTCQYMFTLAPREDVIRRFFEELNSRGFAPDIGRFTAVLEDKTLLNLEKEPAELRSYLDLNRRNNATGSLFPLYTLAPTDQDAKVDQAPCNGLLAFVRDLNTLPQDQALELLQQIREILEREFGAGVVYGPNPEGSGGGGGSQTALSLESATANQETYYSFQPTTQNNVTVAVIDTGVGGPKDPFAGSLILGAGYNFVQGNTDASDTYIYKVPPPPNPSSVTFYQHGSPVAYIASEASQTSSGAAPQIMPVKVCDNNGTTDLNDDCKVSDIIMGICYALKNYNPEADPKHRLVINLSLGGEKPVDLLGNVIWQGIDEGAVIVASGGNDRYFHENYQESYYPGAFECRPSDKITVSGTNIKVCPPSPSSSPTYDTNGLVSVSSVNNTDTRSIFSVRALYNDVAALGEYTTSLLAGRQGTSYATPVVSGIAATILSQKPTATPQQVEACLRTIAQTTNPLNPALGIGTGILDPATVDLGLCSF
jgi:subtilisin family serine protease